MPFAHRTIAALICSLCLVAHPLRAEEAPANLPPADLDTILKNWHEQVSQYQGINASFIQSSYDDVFEVQRMGAGTLKVNRSGEASRVVQGANNQNVRLKNNSKGGPYHLEPAQDETWYWGKRKVIQLNMTDRTFDQIDIPDPKPDAKNSATISSFYIGIIKCMLSHPFLLGMPPEEIKQHYEMSILKQNAEQVRIAFKPKTQQDLLNWSEAELILNLKTYLPYALKIVDPPGTLTTVYLFSEISGTATPEHIPEPDLTGYKSSTPREVTKSRKAKKKENNPAPEQPEPPPSESPSSTPDPQTPSENTTK
ncbi:MAG: hypothetical protein KDA68_13530 [Planctomycetaceae bacterium]|nr:hypothetical protein [Planctomycetaceae bacterium]